MKKLNAECPTCKGPLPVVVGKQNTVRVTSCNQCHGEFEYSAWVIKQSGDITFHKVELQENLRRS